METGGYIGAYRLEQPIGEGGMGAVWKARHPTLDRPVALKLIRSEVKASPQAREAFLREVRALSRLHGPQIVQVTDFGFTDAGDPYMVTEFLEGEDLLARVRRQGPLAPAEAVDIGVEVLKALAEAHTMGLVHRDLKPGNVFLQKLAGGARTAVKVLDFGVAKLLEGDDEDTLWPGARLKGSPRYMAPEQVRGGPITPATDIYAFGAMMYRVLTGKPVFAGERDRVLRAHVELEPPPMNRRTPGLAIPDELEDIVLGCLEKAPADRPGSAGALQARMERLARRLQDAAGADDTPSGLALDWSAVPPSAPPAVDGGPSGSASAPGGRATGSGDLGSWFRTTGELPPTAGSPSAPEAPARPPTGGWQLDMAGSDLSEPGAPSGEWGVESTAAAPPPDPSPPALDLGEWGGGAPAAAPPPDPSPPALDLGEWGGGAPAAAPPPEPAPALELGGWGVDPPPAVDAPPSGPPALERPAPPEPAPPAPEPDTAGLELDTRRAAAPASASMAGVRAPAGGLDLEGGEDDIGLELAFDPASRGAAPPDPPAGRAADAAPEDAPAEPDPPDGDRVDPGPRRPARSAAVQSARVERTPWHEEHRMPLIAGGAVVALLIVVWIGRAALVAEPEAPDAAPAVVDAEPRKLDLGGVPVALDRGMAMLEAPSVARGPASANGAPSPEQRPTVLILPDPPPATFTRLDNDEVICEEADSCRVPIDVDVRVTRKGYRRLTLRGDDLYDRRGSTWRVILRR